MFDRMVNQIATTTASSGASSTSAQAAAALVRFGVISDRTVDKSNEEPIREEDGVLSIDLAETMLKWHAEAVGRCVELTPPNDLWVLDLFALEPMSNDLTDQRILSCCFEYYLKLSRPHI